MNNQKIIDISASNYSEFTDSLDSRVAVFGVAGQLKTESLINRAMFLLNNDHNLANPEQSVFFLTFTKKYKELIYNKLEKTDLDGFNYCNLIHVETVADFMNSGLGRNMPHIIVDEAQNLTKYQINIILMCVQKTVTFGVSVDQTNLSKIFNKTDTDDSVGLEYFCEHFNPVYRLPYLYCSTQKIISLALNINNDFFDHICLPEEEGKIPDIYFCDGYVYDTSTNLERDNEEKQIVNILNLLINEDEDASIGILCSRVESTVTESDKGKIIGGSIDSIRTALEIAVENNELDKEKYESKIMNNIMTPLSAQSLEFDYVLIPYCNKYDYSENSKELLYLAMTRATYGLFILCSNNNKSPLIDLFDKEKYTRHNIDKSGKVSK